MKSRYFILIAMAMLIMLPLVSAAPPVTTVVSSTEGLVIYYPHSPFIKINTSEYVRFWVFNQTDGVLMSSSAINCTFDLFDGSGKNIFKIMSPDIGYGGLGSQACSSCFNINITNSNFTKLGYYPYLIFCNTNPAYPVKLGGSERDLYQVTYRGLDLAGDNMVIFFNFIFLFAIAFMLFTLMNTMLHLFLLDFDVYDAIMACSIYFVVLAYDALEKVYIGSTVIQSWTSLFISVGIWTHVILPMFALAFTMIVGTFVKRRLAGFD